MFDLVDQGINSEKAPQINSTKYRGKFRDSKSMRIYSGGFDRDNDGWVLREMEQVRRKEKNLWW